MLIRFEYIPNHSHLTLLSINNESSITFFKSFKFQVDTKGGNEISIWSLELSNYNKSYINIKLELEDATTNQYLLTTFDVTFKSKVGAQLVCVQKQHLFKKCSDVSSEKVYEKYTPLISDKFLKNNVHYPLEIICNINTSVQNEAIRCVSGGTFDVEKLLNDHKFSDFVVITTTNQFKVHKAILAARSEVFCAMFEHDMLEKKKNSVTITQFDDEVIQELLRFIYCGRVNNLKRLAASLLEAAAMYLIDGLKIMCLENICENVTFENAVNILLMTVKFEVDFLKTRILNFIAYNIKYINRADLKSINDFDLLEEILQKTIKTHLHG